MVYLLWFVETLIRLCTENQSPNQLGDFHANLLTKNSRKSTFKAKSYTQQIQK